MTASEGGLGISRRRYRAFAAIAIVAGLAFGFAALEAGLGYLRHRIETSDHLDPGMMVYDATLGWRPAPGWHGGHRNFDFDVSYTINESGFRGRFDTALSPQKTRRVGMLGDSFTFGMGVEEGETFVDVLNRSAGPREIALNFGVPGYSTDQQLLLAERVLPGRFRPTELLLVVYLGNDLIDNMLPYPIQGIQGKPYFQIAGQRLSLQNVPVPLRPKTKADPTQTPSALVLEGGAPPTLLERIVGKLETVRRLGIVWPRPAKVFPAAAEKVRPSIDLFAALVIRLRDMAARRNVPLRLVLMPGRSFFAAPESYSGQYQDYVRRAIEARMAAIGMPLLDLGEVLRNRIGASSAADLYFHNDGHLNPEGNRVVGGILVEALGFGRAS